MAETRLTYPVLAPDSIARKYELGSGGYGVVYKAKMNGQSVAIKVAKSRLAPLESEATILANLDSPYVVKCFGMMEKDESKFLIMEYVNGGSLSFTLDRHKITTSQQFDAIILDTARGIDFIHQCGIVHNDLTELNILVNKQLTHAKLCDFEKSNWDRMGISRLSAATEKDDIWEFGGVLQKGSSYFKDDDASYAEKLKSLGLWCQGKSGAQPTAEQLVQRLEDVSTQPSTQLRLK